MNIRPIQLTLFGDPAPVMMGGCLRAAWITQSLKRQNTAYTSKTVTAAMSADGALSNSKTGAVVPD